MIDHKEITFKLEEKDPIIIFNEKIELLSLHSDKDEMVNKY
jgi:hypothetical protein